MNEYEPFRHRDNAGLSAGPGTRQAPTANGPKPGKRVGAGVFIACLVAAGTLGGGVVAGAATMWSTTATSAGAPQTSQYMHVIVNNPDSVTAVTAAAQKASPSVVTISVSSGTSGGTGSGIILDAAGHILTNTHVVTLDGQAANPAVEVRLSDGTVYPGTVLGTDPLSDLAIVQISAPGLVPAALGDSGKVSVGDTAIAIGAPLGLSGTVTDGIVSASNRTIETASSGTSGSQGGSAGTAQGSISINVIQTDAAINPGNSGGPLVNTNGEVIGVNVAIASAGTSAASSAQPGNIGVGFSIPVNDAKRVAREIIATGTATHGQLGLTVRDKASGTSSEFTAGAEVSAVTPGSAVSKAGIKAGDVITGLGERSVSDASELTAAAHEQGAGATVKLTFVRGGQTQTTEVTLGAATGG
jgi:putative serine protease PepD